MNYAGVYEPPFLSTVTYLSDCGAPTVILPVWHPACPQPQSVTSLAQQGDVATVSFPRVGKHLVFDGRRLHGCPAGFELLDDEATDGAGAVAPPHARVRVSLLVNVWLGHRPLLCEPLADAWLADLGPTAALDKLPCELAEPGALIAELHAPARCDGQGQAGGHGQGQAGGVDGELAAWCGLPARFRAQLAAHGRAFSTLRVRGVNRRDVDAAALC